MLPIMLNTKGYISLKLQFYIYEPSLCISFLNVCYFTKACTKVEYIIQNVKTWSRSPVFPLIIVKNSFTR